MDALCPICEGAGLRVIQQDGHQFATECVCRTERRANRLLERARIPKRYEHCSLESFETQFGGANRTLEGALITARGFVEGYPLETNGTGLLFVGAIGVGKTHLATAILQSLVSQHGIRGHFCDFRDLLKQVQHSYNQSVAATEIDVLRPVFNAEVLVIDELGSARQSEWVEDTVAHILNTRYNDRKTTILTTNYPNAAPLNTEAASGEARDAVQYRRRETLGDRIGERMRSRLQEMCVVVEMQGQDFRQKVKRASFA